MGRKNDAAEAWPSADSPGPRGRSGRFESELEACRQYLRLVAAKELAPELEPKVGVSDMVQEAFLEAIRDAGQFDGDGCDPAGLRAWLRTILINNIRNTARRYRRARKRDIGLEVPLHDESGRVRDLEAELDSPSSILIHQEIEGLLEGAIRRLPDPERQIVQWRYRQNETFEAIGRRLGMSHVSARAHWLRALERLRKDLERS
jgi:RNA polymerase sigma-70 factor (ECF subfamily)